MEARINEEAERATHYLDETTEPRIVEVSDSFSHSHQSMKEYKEFQFEEKQLSGGGGK